MCDCIIHREYLDCLEDILNFPIISVCCLFYVSFHFQEKTTMWKKAKQILLLQIILE